MCQGQYLAHASGLVAVPIGLACAKNKCASFSAFFIIHDNSVGDDEGVAAATPGNDGSGVRGDESPSNEDGGACGEDGGES
ncbi:unnamed protein product [Lupinus luteus]|uniref:Uncharacterized protein n=1 Tax=Lupinus luteus TaxID=3873 RepID=A0AAV1VR45_LUPLU